MQGKFLWLVSTRSPDPGPERCFDTIICKRMTHETIAWSVALFLLVIDVLLIVIYLLLKERLCRKETEPRCGCPGDGEPVPEE